MATVTIFEFLKAPSTMPRSRGAWWGALFCALSFLLSGCASSDLLDPIGIGSDRDALKRSPCACYELPQRGPIWKIS